MLKSRFEFNVPEAEYRASAGLTQSALKEFARTPAHYRAYVKAPRKQTPAQRLGELAHLAVFQPDLFRAKVVMAPKVNRATKEGKAQWESFCATHIGKEFVTNDDYGLICTLSEILHGHPEVGPILESQSGFAEVSLWSECEETGVLCKGRLDWFDTDQIYDLKTTDDASPGAFVRTAVNLKYHWQAAHYLTIAEEIGVKAPQFTWIVIEKTQPFGVALYHLEPEDLRRAQSERMSLLRYYAACTERNEWPGYPTASQSLSLPSWAWSRAVRGADRSDGIAASVEADGFTGFKARDSSVAAS